MGKLAKPFKKIGKFAGDLLTGGAISARETAKDIRQDARRQEREAAEQEAEQRRRRQQQQRAALQAPSEGLFSALGRPDL